MIRSKSSFMVRNHSGFLFCSSNDSGDGSQKTSVRKDRPCPFCRQPFTSSSLGRHLDLYIKEKNPKAPDGIHDVEQIKKLRGKITRRHARVSSSAPNGMGRPGQSPSAGVSSMKPQPLEPQPLASEGHAPRSSFSIESSVNGRPQAAINKLNWQATGVINDLPPRFIDPKPHMLFRPTDPPLEGKLKRIRKKMTQKPGGGREASVCRATPSITSPGRGKPTRPVAHDRDAVRFCWPRELVICHRCCHR